MGAAFQLRLINWAKLITKDIYLKMLVIFKFTVLEFLVKFEFCCYFTSNIFQDFKIIYFEFFVYNPQI